VWFVVGCIAMGIVVLTPLWNVRSKARAKWKSKRVWSLSGYYASTTEFNCGIDLHARQMYVCLMDRQGKILVHTNVRNNDFDCSAVCFWIAPDRLSSGLELKQAHTGLRRHRNDSKQ
jgi:hypothetical protein